MIHLGLLCNCTKKSDPMQALSPSLVNRAFLIDRLLRPQGLSVFLYSPASVQTLASVPGYTVDGNGLRPATLPVPRVNANWTYATRRLLNRGMGYTRFKHLARDNGIGIYVPYAFSELVSNKRKTYDVLRRFDPTLHPYTEDFLGSVTQLGEFLERGRLVFIKPRAGNRGNQILVLRRRRNGHSVKFYDQGAQRLFTPLTLEAGARVIEAAVGHRAYVIQQGVESLKADGAVFDVRVVMVNDGSTWHPILETRLAPRGSDLSNVFQGGRIRVTEEVLTQVLGDAPARELADEIRRVSHGVASHFEALYPGELMEMGFDFVVDRRRKSHLVEVNAKPGVAGFGSETVLFEWAPEDERHYRHWVYPHVEHLARFLQRKAERAAVTRT